MAGANVAALLGAESIGGRYSMNDLASPRLEVDLMYATEANAAKAVEGYQLLARDDELPRAVRAPLSRNTPTRTKATVHFSIEFGAGSSEETRAFAQWVLFKLR
jgi:hypothetical protein